MSNQSKPAEPTDDDFREKLPKLLGIQASPDDIWTLLEHLRNGAPLRIAAAAAGIPLEETRSPALALVIAKMEAAYEAAMMKFVTHAATRDWHAAAFLLERRFPERWGRHQAEERAKAASGARVRVAVPEASPEEQTADEVEAEQPPVQAVRGAE